MRKYRWSLLKSLEFLNSRRPDLEIRATFIHQLSAYEQRLQQKFNKERFTSKWDELSEEKPYVTSEELILRNTFINAQMGPLADFRAPKHSKVAQLKWIDQVDKTRSGKEALKGNDFKDDLLNKKTLQKVQSHTRDNSEVKRALRARNLTLAKITGVKNFDQTNLYTREELAMMKKSQQEVNQILESKDKPAPPEPKEKPKASK